MSMSRPIANKCIEVGEISAIAQMDAEQKYHALALREGCFDGRRSTCQCCLPLADAGTSSRTCAILFGNPLFGSTRLQGEGEMAQTAPIIQGEILTYQQDGQSAQVTVDTAGWYSWLETATTFTFRSEHGTFTAHKERAGNKRGGKYWRAYRKRHGKLHRAYLGKSEELTLERLKKVAAVLAGQGPAEGSSRRDLPTGTITLLFTDIEGSTRLLQQLGDRYEVVLADCRRLLRRAFQAQHGQEVDTQGDSFFVAFARATDALSAAVEAQRALASHPWPAGAAVRVRMGLHTGEPSLTHGDFVGLDVHHAARIMSAGHGGQVLLSQTTHDLVEYDLPDDVGLRDLGEHHLKDLGRPIRLFQAVISDLPADFPPLKTLDTHPHNLPVQPTPLIGREREVATVCELLRRDELRLVTLTGPGGIGKTRLGVQVAAELSELFVDGMFFVDLAPLSDPALVVPTIAQRLDIREGTGQSLLERLKEGLHQKQALLLLDNFEQVLGAAVQVADLLTACPRLKVLVTSRERLHVRAEQEFSVPPLALPATKLLPDLAALAQYEAVTLFIVRTQAAKPDFQMTHANAPAIVEICIRLDGLPLAIELAAARSKLLPPQALLARLGQRLAVLTSGARDMPARQQTLRNTIAWSYHLLEALEQRLFRRLSAFVGGCTLEAIEAVCMTLGDEAGAVLDAVASLIDKSLLQQTEQEGEEPRLVMLETIREYGLECLATSGEAEAARHAHAAYYLQLAEAAPDLFGTGEQIWIDRLEWEHDNLRGAMNWLLEHRAARESIEMTLRLGAALWWFWLTRGYRHEGWTFLERALAGSERVAEPVRAKALWAAGNLAAWLGHFERGEALCQESLVLAQQIGDAEGMRNAVFHLGFIAGARGDFAAARPLFERSIVLSREAGDKFLLGHALNFLAFEALSQGEYARARLLIEEGLAAFKELGHKTGMILSLKALACVMFFQGDLESARALGEECITRQKEFGGKHAEAGMLAFLGNVTLHQGDILTARMLLEKSGVLLREVIDEENQMAWTLSLFGKVNAVQGDYIAARACYEGSLQSLVHVQTTPNNNMPFLDLASVLEGLAAVVAAQGELAWAVRLWSAAEALRETRSIPLPPLYRADYERAVAAARTQLGEKTFAALWSEGQSMTPEQALAARGPATMSSPSAPSVKPPMTYPDRLTAREVEVLRLVAQGLSDTQVAEKLVISPRTVNTHLKSIYGKIQVSSRSAATRYAMEQHLV